MALLPTVERIYTDGACSGNPGPGGWGVLAILKDGRQYEVGGAAADTTNNRMELQAAIAALTLLKQIATDAPVTLHTDSEYVKNGITRWIHGWKKKNWQTSAGKAVLNQDLWQELDILHQAVKAKTALSWVYVRGHSGDPGNDRCDAIARAFSLGRPIDLKQDFSLETASNPSTPAEASPGDIPIKKEKKIDAQDTKIKDHLKLESAVLSSDPEVPMADSGVSHALETIEDLPREVRVANLRNTLETLHIADEIAKQSYLITSSELADLMDVNASAVTSRGEYWAWRNWTVSRVRREGNQILWQLERID